MIYDVLFTDWNPVHLEMVSLRHLSTHFSRRKVNDQVPIQSNSTSFQDTIREWYKKCRWQKVKTAQAESQDDKWIQAVLNVSKQGCHFVTGIGFVYVWDYTLFHVCAVSLCIVINSLEERELVALCVLFRYSVTFINVCYYLFSVPLDAIGRQ